MQKKLYRSERNKAICGVCGGLGDYFGIDPIIVRLIFVLLFLTYGMGLTFYVVCALVIPKEPAGPIEAEFSAGGEGSGNATGLPCTPRGLSGGSLRARWLCGHCAAALL